jgi:hypothetical protein
VRSPREQSVPTLQNSGSTYSPRGRTHHRSCRAVYSHCTPRVPCRLTRRDSKRSRSTPNESWSYQDRRDLVQRSKFKPSTWRTLRFQILCNAARRRGRLGAQRNTESLQSAARNLPSSRSYSPVTGFAAGTGAIPQGNKCTYTSTLQAPAMPRDPTRLWQDSPQEQECSPRGQSVPTLRNSGSTYSPRGRTHHRSCRAVCSHCAPRVPCRPARRDFKRSRFTPRRK